MIIRKKHLQMLGANWLPFAPSFPMQMFSGFHDRLLAVDRSLILEPPATGSYPGRCPERTIGQVQSFGDDRFRLG